MSVRARITLLVLLSLLATACASRDGASATTGPVAFPTPTVAPSDQPATTFHVSPDGDDGAAGTLDAPWGSLTAALPRLQPGHTLVVHGGTYTERIRNVALTPGTAEAPVRVVAATGERPVLQGLLWLRDADHWVLDGLNVTWDPATGTSGEHMVKFTDGTGWSFQNAEVWGARSYAAILVATSGGAEPADWRIAGNCVHDTIASNGTNQDHLIYVNSGLASGPGRIAGNLLFGAPNGNGVKLGGPRADSGGAARVSIVDNTIHDTAQNVLIAYGAHDNLLEGNLLSQVGAGYGNVRGYQLDGVGNVARGNAGAGAETLILNDDGYTGVSDGGGNVFPVEPEFEAPGACGGFVPTNAEAAGYGHLADHVEPATDQPVRAVASRVAGPDRVATAIAVARFGWDRAETVVLARADDPADALAGAALAGHLDAPLLITPSGHTTADLRAALAELQVRRAVLLGGPAALSAEVAGELSAAGIAVERIAGPTRDHTAAAIADRVGPARRAFLVRGQFAGAPDRTWPDALAVSGAAARAAADGQPSPILLSGETVPTATLDALRRLGVEQIVLVGGDAVLPAALELGLRAGGYEVSRWAGDSRYATSRLVADRAGVQGPLVVATGGAFPDGLAAGALAARVDGTLLLSPVQPDLDNVAWITGHRTSLDGVIAIGGTAALAQATVDAYATAAS